MASEPAAEAVVSNPSMAGGGAALFGRYRWWLLGSTIAIVAVASAAWVLGRSHAATPPAGQPSVVERGGDKTPDVAATTPGENVQQETPTEPPAAAPAKESLVAAPAGSPAAAPVSGEKRVGADNPAGIAAQSEPVSSPAAPAKSGAPVDGAGTADVDPLMPEAYGTAGGKSPDGAPQPTDPSTTAMEEKPDDAAAFDPVKQARLMTHLQDGLPALEFTAVPLGQFVAFLSEFSTVPMVIDTQSLVAAGKSAKTRISVKLDDATVEEALKAALDKPGLAFHIEPGRLVITPRAAKSK